jgi:O-antigen/teichoic acid export membrane protein
MLAYLKRLVKAGAAYQVAEIVAKAIALVTLPLYTRHVGTAEYGAANILLTSVILASIVLRLGLGEAFVRFFFDDQDPLRRARIARSATAAVAWTTTLAAAAALAFAGPLSELLLGYHDPVLLDCATLGLWAFTNLEMAYALLRVEERTRAYMIASGTNVALTVTITVILVVFAGQQARGLLLGNFGASAIVVVGLWWVLRDNFSLRPRRELLDSMLRFGLPTVPADASVYALQVVDRFYLDRTYSSATVGVYAAALQMATVVFLAVRGFQYAWPPLAYSIEDDAEAAELYSLVTTYYVLATGAVVCGVALLGRWLVRLLVAAPYFDAYKPLPWLALGWALYGLYLVFVVISGRARVTSRNLGAAAAGLAVNVGLLVALVPHGGAGLGTVGAGLALCGAYAVMVSVMYLLTRAQFSVGFEWLRLGKLVAIFASVAVSGELLLPTSGAGGLLLRIAWMLFVPALLVATRFFHAHELAHVRMLLVQGSRRAGALRGRAEEADPLAEDPSRYV